MKSHSFHLVDPSPWPALGAFGVLVSAIGLVLFMHDGGPVVLIIGAALIVATMYLWWTDVIREGHVEGHHTSRVQIGLREGMGLFIASEVMFFVAFFWAFFHNSMGGSPTVPAWPPAGVEPFNPWTIPFLNTLILVSSGIVLEWGHHGLRTGHEGRLKTGLVLAFCLGALFVSLQIYEYGEATFGFKEGIYPSVFYMATGFHGFHVCVGVVFLAVCWLRALKNQFKSEQHVGLEAASWYWHFVDVVWIFLFSWIYVWGT